jgi:hypothetical protein
MQAHAELLADYEIAPGRRLIDTNAEERLTLGVGWSLEMQESRLAYMGLA